MSFTALYRQPVPLDRKAHPVCPSGVNCLFRKNSSKRVCVIW